MTTNDLQLLSRYHLHGDSTAFRDLVQTHAGMVFATAKRITCDQSRAEDVAQETFLQLAHQSRHITQSVAAWLHRVAWRRACNAVRDDATRRRIEEEAAAIQASENEPNEKEASWAEVEKVLDAAIDELPDNLRAPLVMHFLQGRAQRDIAEQIGVSQSTVSRMIEEGLSSLRSRLKTRGVLCGTGLALLLMTNSAGAAPAALIVSLGKLSMSGIGAATTGTKGALGTAWLKVGLTMLLTAGSIWLVKNPPAQFTDENQNVTTVSNLLGVGSPKGKSTPQVAVPTALVLEKLPVSESNTPAVTTKPTPQHELVHSFPTPPKTPSGHLVQDEQGWLWGTTGGGGHYGVGTLYRMKRDGSEWEEMVSFNGRAGLPKGRFPIKGVARAPDGRLWGMTVDPGTIFCFDPHTGTLSTELEFEKGEEATGLPIVLPGGQIGFSNRTGTFLYDPSSKKRTLVTKRTDSNGNPITSPHLGEMVSDGRGWLWATSENSKGNGCVYKVNPFTGELAEVLSFTGKAGSCPGKNPVCGLSMASDGYLWGCTRKGGENDQGTVFKIHPETAVFASVTHFQMRDGMNPESMLVDDGQGFMWGTATDGGGGQGTIYKVERSTGMLSVVVRFTGYDGAAPGGTPRGHLLRAGPDHFVGVTNYWGAAWSGVIYRVDIPTGKYTVLKDLADLSTTTEGEQPRGSLVETSDGNFWGTTHFHGAHHCGTIYRLDPASQRLVSVVDFTGKGGPFPGRSPDAGLVSDGRGWLWGTTRFGGQKDMGSIFKLNEQSGEFRTIAEFGTDMKTLPGGGPMTEMVRDERGQLWGTANNTVFQVDPQSNTVKHITALGGDKREPFGSNAIGRLVADGLGYVWGCALADRTHHKASLFRIRTTDAVFETMEVFPDAGQGWSGWHPMAQMYRDSSGSIWFSGVLGQGGTMPHCTLNRLDPITGRVVDRHFSRTFPIIDTPVEDGHGRMWGAVSTQRDALYTFDLASGAFQRALEFTGHGSQYHSGSQPMFGRPMRASDGNIYSVTRYGGPGNGGTIYRLRFGPTPMTQEAVILSDGRVELHGVMRPNGRDTDTAFEWSTDPRLKGAHTLQAGIVRADEKANPIQAVLSGLKRGTPHYFRISGRNADNAMPQRGAILQFIIPLEESGETTVAAVSTETQSDSTTSSPSGEMKAEKRYKLKIVMVPGAGAGIVLGRFRGETYEIGKSYTLTAKADNRYVFTHWSGPGISGPMAENQQLKFTFTEELAKNPVITATFVNNPFHEGLLGPYHGLVRAVEGVASSIDTTGALEVQLTELGDFTGVLRYDGEEWPLAGVFDTGGSARFGEELAFIAVIRRPEKPALLLSLQLDLSEKEAEGISGQIGLWNNEEATWRSQIHLLHSVPAATLVDDAVIQHLNVEGSLNVEMLALDSNEVVSAGQVLLQPDGRLQFSASLPDGTVILNYLHLSRHSRFSFFHPFPGGSLGMEVPLADLLRRPDEYVPNNSWWLPTSASIRPVTLQAVQSGTAEK